MVKRRKSFRPRCRYCRTNANVIPIVYGIFPNEELLQKERLGQLKLGGNARSVDAPNWYCKACGHEFLK